MSLVKPVGQQSEAAPQNQPDRCPRRERRIEIRKIRRLKKKLERKLRPMLLDVEFSNETTTTFGNFHLLETFKQSIDFYNIIGENFTLKKSPNSTFSAKDTLSFLIDSCALGYSRFDHTETLRYDPGYMDLRGIDRFPSEKVFRDLFSKFSLKNLQELCEINRKLLELRSRWEGPKEIWFDIDSTVITIFGEQEGGEKRYNPHYKGRPSYELMLCFNSKTNDLIYLEICPTGTTPKAEFKNFLAKCINLVPANYVLKGIRLDKGFFSENNIEYLETNYFDYVAKVPLYQNIRNYLERIPETEWAEINDFTSVTRKKLLLDNWQHDRYIDIRRMKTEKKSGQLFFPSAQFYRYEAVLASEIEQEPQKNLCWYDGRGTAEDLIKEVKYGFAVDETSQHQQLRNTSYLFIKAIAYNLFQFFKSAVIPASHQSWQIETVRRKIINISGNILGRTRFRRVKLAPRAYLEMLLPLIKKELDRFLWFVANGFRRLPPKIVMLL